MVYRSDLRSVLEQSLRLEYGKVSAKHVVRKFDCTMAT